MSTADHPLARKAIKIIEHDIARHCTLDELSAKLNVNKSYLARIFKQTTGFTVTEYVKHRRCETAAVLLLTDELPIWRVSQQVGYDDMNYFARCFKKHFGTTAHQYRLRKFTKI